MGLTVRKTEVILIAVITTALAVAVTSILACVIRDAGKAEEPARVSMGLPEKCAPHYNDGTDAWKDCMGVGYK